MSADATAQVIDPYRTARVREGKLELLTGELVRDQRLDRGVAGELFDDALGNERGVALDCHDERGSRIHRSGCVKVSL